MDVTRLKSRVGLITAAGSGVSARGLSPQAVPGDGPELDQFEMGRR